MLTEAQNEQLTRVGPGTPMGDLLRRYWMPIAGASELDENPVKAMRLFGEDLVLYRDLSGQHGLVDRQCAHRRADLSYGFVEKQGLRCNYHGWSYDAGGVCVSRPYEDIALAPTVKKACIQIKAYPVQEKAGLIWAYMGPQPAPLLPDWEPFSWPHGFVQIVNSVVPCNWLQCQENSIDPVHFEWMHNNWTTRQKGALGPYSPEHKELAFEEFEYGLVYKRIRGQATKDDPMWTIGRVCLWPNAFFLGDHFEWRIPIDDDNTLSITWSFVRVPAESEPYVQTRIPTWYSPIKDPQTGLEGKFSVFHAAAVAIIDGAAGEQQFSDEAARAPATVALRKRVFPTTDASVVPVPCAPGPVGNTPRNVSRLLLAGPSVGISPAFSR